ncbi:MAG: MBL fold metallo-hydrolase [Crocinitomicaceae bacterium]|nr:MBL fold metallo-hydrolase [Crocinitomicaceae bacterium]
MIKIEQFTFNPFQENTYVLYDESKECVIIDPGCYEPHEQEELAQFIANKELNPVILALTHSHIDHVLGSHFICNRFKLKPQIHRLDLETLRNVKNYAHVYGFSGYQPSPEPEIFLKEENPFTFGNSTLEIRFVPGHAPGHIVFISHEDKFVINGDCIFYGSIGRTDLPGGDHQTLLSSIRNALFSLPDDYKVYTGHGIPTTIGFEKENNPFLQEELES